MSVLWLELRAPFAAFRWMQAGVWRGSSPIIPPSAAWGLVLNLAGVETRDTDSSSTTTQVRSDAPSFEVAIGEIEAAGRGTLYQQLHSYPVGNAGKESKGRTFGAKYWIAPVRREFLVGLRTVLGVRSNDDGLLERVRRGIRGDLAETRYGLPFAGDNNLLFDEIVVRDEPTSAVWYSKIQRGDPPRRGSCRLTIGIDRSDSSRTTSAMFARVDESSVSPPETAWTWVPRERAMENVG